MNILQILPISWIIFLFASLEITKLVLSNIRHKDFFRSFVLSHAQGNTPGLWNGLYWRALVKSPHPNIWKLRDKHFFPSKKNMFEILIFFKNKSDFSRLLDLKKHFWKFLYIYLYFFFFHYFYYGLFLFFLFCEIFSYF